MKKREIDNVFESFKSIKALIIGDVMMDAYLWGKVNRLSPEAPVPIVSVDKKENRLGGAANVALNIQALGATPILCAFVGNDREGQDFIQLLKKQKISTAGILKSKKRVTTVKTRVIGNNHQLLRVDEEVEDELTPLESNAFTQLVLRTIQKEKIDVVIFEDYDKGLITKNLIETVVDFAGGLNIPIVVDPKKKNFYHYKNVSLFKPNLKEFKEGTTIDLEYNKIKEHKKKVDLFRKKQGIAALLITMSEHGVFVSDKILHKMIPAHVRSISDVSGAGDTVVSVAALCLAVRLPVVLAASMANLAGGLVCEKTGVVPIDQDQLRKEMLSIDL